MCIKNYSYLKVSKNILFLAWILPYIKQILFIVTWVSLIVIQKAPWVNITEAFSK